MWPLHFLLNFDIRALFLFFFVLLLIADYLRYKNPPNFPPGPLSFPFVGSFFRVDKTHPHNYYNKVNRQAPYADHNIKIAFSPVCFWVFFFLELVCHCLFICLHSCLMSMGTCLAFALVVEKLCLHVVTKW